MNQIKRDNYGYSIVLGGLCMFMDDEEKTIRIKRFGNKILNSPFVIFIKEANNITLVVELHKLKLELDNLNFIGKIRNQERLHGKIVIQNDKMILNIQSNNNNDIVGIMWPAIGEIYTSDNIECINKNYTYSAYFNIKNNNDPYKEELIIPTVHCIHKNTCLGIFCDHPFHFNVFPYNYNTYCNLENKNIININFRIDNDKRTSMNWWYNNHTYPIQTDYFDCLDPYRMQEILYHNIKKIDFKDDIHKQTKEIKYIQNILETNKIPNCVIGSYAMFIHNIIKHTTKDIDILVASKDHLMKCESFLSSMYNIRYSNSLKWENKSISIDISNNIKIDISYVNNLNFEDDIITKNGIKTISVENLLFMKLLGEYETNLLNPGYNVFAKKNRRNVYKILKTLNNVFSYPFLGEFLDNIDTDRFIYLYEKINGSVRDNVIVKVNKPLYCNVYNNGHNIIVPVINRGEPQPTVLYIEKDIKKADWNPLIAEEPRQKPRQSVVMSYNNYSKIYIDKVYLLGILVLYE